MSNLDMDGPYELSREEVERVVSEPFAGNFALGYLSSKKKFIIQFVGRSDSCVRDAIIKNLPKKTNGKQPGFLGRFLGDAPSPPAFKFSYAADPEAAYLKQCKNYHDFGSGKELRNASHPKRPSGGSLICPVCSE